MITKLGPWRLTVAIVAALAVLLLVPGSGLVPSTVSADVSSISSGGVSQVIDNQQATITVNAQDDDGFLVISTNDADDTLTFNSCSGAGPCAAGIVSGSGTSSVTINTNANSIDADNNVDGLSVSLTLRADCDSDTEVITVTATQDGDANSLNITCGPVDDDTNITIHKQANFTNASFRFVYSVSNGTCAAYKGGAQVGAGNSDDFTLSDDQSVTLDCTNNAVVTVTEDYDATLVDVTGCGNETGVSEGSRSVQINTALTDSSVTCTFVNQGSSAIPASIQLSASNLTPNCGTTVTISAYVINSNGAVASNGTVVTFSAAPGTLSSSTASTVNGVATVTYTVPANYANIVSITANTGSASAVGQLRSVCIVAPPVSSPAAPPPVTQAPAPQPAPRPPLVVAPPSAGDGGLLGGGGFNWTLFAGIILAASLSVGASLVLQREKAD